MDGKRIVVLGGGLGGIVCVNRLRELLGKEHRIILVDEKDSHVYYPSLLWLIFGWRRAEEIRRDFNLLTKKGIEFLKGALEEIQVNKKIVIVDGKELKFDYLVISTGTELDKKPFPKTPGIYNFYCLEGAALAGEKIKSFSSGRVVILIGSAPFKCPAAPYELGFLLDSFFKNKKIRDRVEIEIYTPEPLPMPTAGERMGLAIKSMLEKRNIGFNPGHKFESVSEDEIDFGNNKNVGFDLLLYVPINKGPQFLRNTELVNEAGWIPVDRETLKTKFENIYAIGDITTIKLPGQYEPNKPLNLPKAGVFSHYQAEVAAERIYSEIHGEIPNRKFKGKGSCFLESGNSVSSFADGNFYKLPYPKVRMYPPLRIWHWVKICFEKWWLWRWF